MNTTVTKEQFEDLKQQYGYVYCVTILDCDYVFRAISGAEFLLYQSASQKKQEKQLESLIKNLILFPDKEDLEARMEINGLIWPNLAESIFKTLSENSKAKEKTF